MILCSLLKMCSQLACTLYLPYFLATISANPDHVSQIMFLADATSLALLSANCISCQEYLLFSLRHSICRITLHSCLDASPVAHALVMHPAVLTTSFPDSFPLLSLLPVLSQSLSPLQVAPASSVLGEPLQLAPKCDENSVQPPPAPPNRRLKGSQRSPDFGLSYWSSQLGISIQSGYYYYIS